MSRLRLFYKEIQQEWSTEALLCSRKIPDYIRPLYFDERLEISKVRTELHPSALEKPFSPVCAFDCSTSMFFLPARVLMKPVWKPACVCVCVCVQACKWICTYVCVRMCEGHERCLVTQRATHFSPDPSGSVTTLSSQMKC